MRQQRRSLNIDMDYMDSVNAESKRQIRGTSRLVIMHAIIHMSDLIESIATKSTSRCPRMAEETIALSCGKAP